MTMTILGTTGDFPIFNKKEEREREREREREEKDMMMVTMTIMMLAIRKQIKGYCTLTGRFI